MLTRFLSFSLLQCCPLLCPSPFSLRCFYISSVSLPPTSFIPTCTLSLSQSHSFAILNPDIPISTTSPVPTPPPSRSTHHIRQSKRSSPSSTASSSIPTSSFASQVSILSSLSHMTFIFSYLSIQN